jgi:hypothetical protein
MHDRAANIEWGGEGGLSASRSEMLVPNLRKYSDGQGEGLLMRKRVAGGQFSLLSPL